MSTPSTRSSLTFFRRVLSFGASRLPRNLPSPVPLCIYFAISYVGVDITITRYILLSQGISRSQVWPLDGELAELTETEENF